MKRTARILPLLILIMMLASSGSFAATYGYQINILSGNQGVFKGNQTKITINKGYGEWVSLDTGSLDVKVKNDKYFVKGLKKAGADTNSSEVIQSTTMQVVEDQSYIVAYGLKKDMVKYTVSYLDKDGKKLLKDDTYDGVVGDKPIVSFKYVAGYVPEAYNETKTLSKDEKQNVFKFYYDESGTVSEESAAPAKENKEAKTEDNKKTEKKSNNDTASDKSSEDNDSNKNENGSSNSNDRAVDGQRNTAAVQNGAGQNDQTADQAATIDNADNDGNNDGQNDGEGNNSKPKKLVDLDDNETPLASGDRNKNKSGFLAQNWILVTSIAVVLGALILVVFLKRKKKTDANE